MTKKSTAFNRALKTALFAGGLMFAGGAALAQDDDAEDKDEDKGPPSIEEKTEDFEKSEGLFAFYTDPKSGDVYMEIAESQLDDEFVAFSYAENGVLEAGAFRGFYRDQRVISINRHFDKLEFVEENTAFYFDEENAIARAKDANISPAILATASIAAKTEAEDDAAEDDSEADETRYLVQVNDLFLTEALHQVKPSPDPDAPPGGFSIGELSGDKTKFADIRNYPENSDIIVDYVFESRYPTVAASAAVTDERAITVKVQHSLIAVPEDGFVPRYDDYRVGYFRDEITDLTSDKAAPYRDLITRWRLEKQDPDAAVSDPVKPITWWIENTTPEEYRDTIRDAVLAWNSSFELAGFSNAIEVQVQPDDADWDAGDIRYNVLRWTSSPVPPFGGYGPSFTNPRTGEIVGADIMLEYSFITNRWVFGDAFEDSGLAVMGDPFKTPVSADARNMCAASSHLYANTQFGLTALRALGANDITLNELVKEAIYYLMLHEVGHTLGLNHNMKASIIHGPDAVHDKSVTNGAPTASVMDYPSVNIAPPGVEQGDYYQTRPGPYDDWAIVFGYSPDIEGAAREAHLAQSTDPLHTFGNDADDMRSPGAGIDPRVMINDLSSDPVQYGADRLELLKVTLPKLVEKYDDEASWQMLRRGYLFATGQQAIMGQVISRQIGGVYVDRTAPGQEGVLDAPFTAVPLDRQKAAMKALKDYVFAADAFDAPEDLLSHLQAQRRGFNFFGGTEDPKLHGRALEVQHSVLNHLLHPVVLQRMTDSSLYGNEYSAAEMLGDLTDAVFGGDLRGNPNAFRRNLQVAYLERLTSVIDNPTYDPTARAAALASAQDVRGRLGGLLGGIMEMGLSAETKAHRAQINRTLRMVGI